MAQPWAEAFYNSKKWKRCRKAYIDKRILIDGGLCEVCRKNHGYIVHHIIMLNETNIKNPDISLNHEHLRYECKACHDQEEGHGLNKKILPVLAFDDAGDPIPP